MTPQKTYTVTTQNYHSCEMQHNKNSHIKTPYSALKHKQNIKVPQSTHPLSPASFVFYPVFSPNCSNDNKSFFHAFLYYAKLILWTVCWWHNNNDDDDDDDDDDNNNNNNNNKCNCKWAVAWWQWL